MCRSLGRFYRRWRWGRGRGSALGRESGQCLGAGHLLDAIDERLRLKRLRKMTVSFGLPGLALIERVEWTRKQQHRNLRGACVIFHRTAELVAVLLRHRDVGQDHGGLGLREASQRFFPIGRADDFEFGPPGTCGKDGQGVPVGDGVPTLRVSSLTVGGTAA